MWNQKYYDILVSPRVKVPVNSQVRCFEYLYQNCYYIITKISIKYTYNI